MKRSCLILLLLVAAPLAAAPAPAKRYKVGDSMAEVTLQRLNKKPVKLSEYAGKTLVLVFLGSFSRRAKDVASEVEKRLKPKLPKNVVVAYVHVEPTVAAATFRKELQLTGETWVDPKAKLLVKLGYKSIPAAVVIDSKSVLRYAAQSFSRAKLETKVKQIASG